MTAQWITLDTKPVVPAIFYTVCCGQVGCLPDTVTMCWDLKDAQNELMVLVGEDDSITIAADMFSAHNDNHTYIFWIESTMDGEDLGPEEEEDDSTAEDLRCRYCGTAGCETLVCDSCDLR